MKYPCVILAMIFSVALPARAENAQAENQGSVKIRILSKQMRQLNEGSLPRLSFAFPNGAVLSDETNGEGAAIDSLAVTGSDRRITFAIGTRDVKCPFKLRIVHKGERSTFKVKILEDEREYPLPLVISCEGGIPCFYVWERPERYAIDSSTAEFGMEHLNEGEAILALTHLILYRYYHALSSPAHRDAHFCDLTHCQVYRGRLKEKYRFNDTWLIDREKTGNNLFFHARCGGKTFGPEIFGLNGAPALPSTKGPIRDRLWKEGIELCRDGQSSWDRTISGNELHSILFRGGQESKFSDLIVRYNMDSLQIYFSDGIGQATCAPESFRLKVNRVKGWNFLKSNNFNLKEQLIGGEKSFLFHGQGLGHGVGLCQHGAIKLSQLGYSRYEIIEHYYPHVALKAPEGAFSYSPYLSFCIFKMTTGDILTCNTGKNFLLRKMSPGSIFKLMIALFLAKTRPDVFKDYTYSCTGKNLNDAVMPARCWKPGGHGPLALKQAISHSCNLYFSSLYKTISFENFRKFFVELRQCLGIQAELPEITGERQWATLLAGLDSRVLFSVHDYIQLVRFLGLEAAPNDGNLCQPYTPQGRAAVYESLTELFTKGTASGPLKPYGSPHNYLQLKETKSEDRAGLTDRELWGKTGTVVEGTNSASSYGLFIGGSGDLGIVAVLRKGNGTLAARWARLVLLNHAGD